METPTPTPTEESASAKPGLAASAAFFFLGAAGAGVPEDAERKKDLVDLIDGKLIIGVDGFVDGGVDDSGAYVDLVAVGGEVERELAWHGVSSLGPHRIAHRLEL